jgi:hypothetical protein
MTKNSKDSNPRDPQYRVKLMSSNAAQRISLAIWVAITILQGAAISPFKEFKGLDDSYFWLISQSAKNLSIVKGEQFLTMGPLGFLDLADPTWHLGYSLSVFFKLTTALVLWAGINQRFTLVYKNYHLRYMSTTVVATFFSLVNPVSINLTMGMLLYKHKSKKIEIISWVTMIYVLFFVKLLPFFLSILFLGLRDDIRKHLKKIIFSLIFLIATYAITVNVQNFLKMMLGSYEVTKGYTNMRSDDFSYISHYFYFLVFSGLIIGITIKKFSLLQNISLFSIFVLIFKYGFVRHDVFHIVVTFSIISSIGLYILSDRTQIEREFSRSRKALFFASLCTVYAFIFYSIHAQEVTNLSKYNYLILMSITIYIAANFKKLLAKDFFKYWSAFMIATFAISGITPLNPIMPTVVKSSPVSVIQRAVWTYDSILSSITGNQPNLENKYVDKESAIKLIKFLSEKNLGGEFIQISYNMPLNFEQNSFLRERYLPSNPTSTFTNELDIINLNWIEKKRIRWIIFDGKSIGSRQLLNDSPNLFRYIVCNYDVFATAEDHLILEISNHSKCETFKNTNVYFNGETDIQIDSSDFVYLYDERENSIWSKMLNVFWKPIGNMYINGHLMFSKSSEEGTLVHIPAELDFPGSFSLNGDVSSPIKIRFENLFNLAD